MAFNGRGWFKLLGLGFMVAGCVSTPAMQYPGTQIASRRLAVLPSEVVEWGFDFYGKETVDKADTQKAKQNIDDSITYRVRRKGGRSFGAASVEGLDHVQAFNSWAVDTLTEVMVERLALAERNHATVGDFQFPNSLESWRSALDADFVLFTLFLDGRDTVRRALALRSAKTARRAIACVVHLQSGRVVWCNFDKSMTANLMERWGAQKEVDLLLSEMLNQGETAASEPPPTPSTAARLVPADDAPPPPPPPGPPPGPDTPAPAHFQAAPKPSN